MEKEFIPYTEALALKELGFDKACLAQYKKYEIGEAKLDIEFSKNEIISKFDNLVLFCSAPLYQQAFKFLREKYSVHLGICHTMYGEFDCWTNDGDLLERGKCCNFKTYEEAELECLKKLIEIAKNK